MTKTLLKYHYLFITKNENGTYTRWAETNTLEDFNKLKDYFLGCSHPEDFILVEKETNKAMSLIEWRLCYE